MKVSGFWSLAGLVVIGWILVDVLANPTGTAAAFNGVTSLTSTTGNLVTGKSVTGGKG
jgi:hypothetical protein